MGDMLSILILVFFVIISILVKIFTERHHTPKTLTLLITGIILGTLVHSTSVAITPVFFSTLITILFIVLIFDSTVRLRLATTNTPSLAACSFILLFAATSFILFTLIITTFFTISVLSSLILSLTLLGTSSEFLLRLKTRHYITALVTYEEYWTTPIALLAPFFILIITPPTTLIFISDATDFFILTFIKISISIATGTFAGTLFSKLFVRKHSFFLPATLLATVFITFALAHYFGGYGIIAVATFGFFIANALATLPRHFLNLHTHLTKHSSALLTLLFGVFIPLPIPSHFILFTTLAFALFLLVRYLSLRIIHKKHAFNYAEQLVLLLKTPHSSAPCAFLLFISITAPTSIPLTELRTIVLIGLLFILTSNILATILTKTPHLHNHSLRGYLHKKMHSSFTPIQTTPPPQNSTLQTKL